MVLDREQEVETKWWFNCLSADNERTIRDLPLLLVFVVLVVLVPSSRDV